MSGSRQKGSVVIYILIAIFLTGLLIAAMTQGSKKSASSGQLDQMALFGLADIKTIQSAITECAQTYPSPTDVDGDGDKDATDNPNPPFPLYCANAACALATMTSGAAGVDITLAGCPGAGAGQKVVFNRNAGNNFKLLGDTATYTTKYFTDATEGTYIRITRATSDPLWTEAISRLDDKFSECSAAAVTAAGTCANGCFYYWIVRRATSVLGGEAGCP